MTISGDGLTITNEYRRPTGPGPGPGPTDPGPGPKPEPKPEPQPKPGPGPTDPGPGPTEPGPGPTEPGPGPTEPPLIPVVLDPPAKGTVTIDEDGSWTYVPKPGATGKDSFILVHPDGTEELIEIDLDDLPLGTTGVKNGQPILPKTGAASNLVFYTTGLLLIALGVFLRKRKVA